MSLRQRNSEASNGATAVAEAPPGSLAGHLRCLSPAPCSSLVHWGEEWGSKGVCGGIGAKGGDCRPPGTHGYLLSCLTLR